MGEPRPGRCLLTKFDTNLPGVRDIFTGDGRPWGSLVGGKMELIGNAFSPEAVKVGTSLAILTT